MLDVGKYEVITKRSVMIFILATVLSSFNKIARAKAPGFNDLGTPVPFSTSAVISKADLHEIGNKNITLKYNGQEQPVDISGSYRNSGTVYHKVGDTGSWNRTNPSFKEIGEYDVYYYVKGDENHNDLGGASSPIKLKVNVEVDKESWGEKTEDNEVVNYVDKKGMTSAEIDGNKMIWVREESLDHYDPVTGEPVITGTWYGVDNSSGVFAKGSRFWVRWLHPEYDRKEWLEYYEKLDEEHKRRAQKEKLWIFLTGVTGPDGQEYTNLNVNVPYYIQLGDDWDAEDVTALYISKYGDEMVNVEFDTVEGYNSRSENICFPETTRSYARLILRHFSPYAVYDVLDSERETNVQEVEKDNNIQESDLEGDKIDDSKNKGIDNIRSHGLRDVLNVERFKKQDASEDYPEEKSISNVEKAETKDMEEISNEGKIEEKSNFIEEKSKEASNKESKELNNEEPKEISNENTKKSSSKKSSEKSSSIKTGDFDSQVNYLIIICATSMVMVVFSLKLGTNKYYICIEGNKLKMSYSGLIKNCEQVVKDLNFYNKFYLISCQKSLMRQVPFRLIIYQYFGKFNIILHIKPRSIETYKLLWIDSYKLYALTIYADIPSASEST